MTRQLNWLPLAVRLLQARKTEHAHQVLTAKAALAAAQQNSETHALAQRRSEAGWLELRRLDPGHIELDAAFRQFQALRQMQSDAAQASVRSCQELANVARQQFAASHALEQGLERILERQALNTTRQSQMREAQALQEVCQLSHSLSGQPVAPPQEAHGPAALSHAPLERS